MVGFLSPFLSRMACKEKAMQQEAEALKKAIRPQDHVVALDVKGKPWSTEQLAENLSRKPSRPTPDLPANALPLTRPPPSAISAAIQLAHVLTLHNERRLIHPNFCIFCIFLTVFPYFLPEVFLDSRTGIAWKI